MFRFRLPAIHDPAPIRMICYRNAVKELMPIGLQASSGTLIGGVVGVFDTQKSNFRYVGYHKMVLQTIKWG